jgi:hypothetical protein
LRIAAKQGEEGAAPKEKMSATAMGKKRVVSLDFFLLGIEEEIDGEAPLGVQFFFLTYPKRWGWY